MEKFLSNGGQFSSVQFNSLFGLKLFPKNTIQMHTYKHKKYRAQVQRIWTQLQVNGTTKSLSHKSTFHNLAPLIREETKIIQYIQS